MGKRHLAPVTRLSALLTIALGAGACSTTAIAQRPRPPGAAEMQGVELPDAFSFPAPMGTHYTWAEHRRFDASVVGFPARDHDESTLRWDITLRRGPLDTLVLDGRLLGVSFRHDGRTVVSGAPRARVQLVVDSGGSLEDVRGLERASRAIRAAAAPGMAARADRLFSPEALRALLVDRYRLFFGDVVGRPTREGVTWIVPREPGGASLLRRYTVEGTAACNASPSGEATVCSRLRVRTAVDPLVGTGVARTLVDGLVREGSAPAPAAGEMLVRNAGYAQAGTLLVQPSTLLPASAAMKEEGRVLVADGSREYRVDLTATTEDVCTYEGAVDPAGQP